jgi:hypothetical protein
MYKETAVDKLIEYIRALPAGEQKIIAQKISNTKKPEKKSAAKTAKKKIEDFIAYTRKLPTRITTDYKFDREEANER